MFLRVDVTSTVQMHFRSFWRAARQPRLAAHERQHAGKQGGSEVLARADHRRAVYTVCAAWQLHAPKPGTLYYPSFQGDKSVAPEPGPYPGGQALAIAIGYA